MVGLRTKRGGGEAGDAPRRMSPEARRAQLIPCAISAVAAMGLERATHAEVARLAGVSVPTAFVYFPTREDLVAAVLAEVEKFLDEIVAASFALDTPEKQLMALARAFEGAADTRRDLIRVWLDWSTAVREDIWPAYLKVQQRIIDAVAGAVKRERGGRERKPVLADESAARIFVGTGHTVALMKLARVPQAEVDSLIAALVAETLDRG